MGFGDYEISRKLDDDDKVMLLDVSCSKITLEVISHAIFVCAELIRLMKEVKPLCR